MRNAVIVFGDMYYCIDMSIHRVKYLMTEQRCYFIHLIGAVVGLLVPMTPDSRIVSRDSRYLHSPDDFTCRPGARDPAPCSRLERARDGSPVMTHRTQKCHFGKPTDFIRRG